MTSGRETMIRGTENCKNGREKKYNGAVRALAAAAQPGNFIIMVKIIIEFET